jgi:photosystem II stability/assembly factor-like uncharacterized protein
MNSMRSSVHRITSAAGLAVALALVCPQPLVAQEADALFSDLEYRMVGPSRGGRVTAVAGHVDHAGSFYMGATGGGVWKTTDYGITWHNISDGFFSTGSIGAIRVADSDSRIVYVGTGSDGIRSNVITGRGMYKSTDAGATWTFIGLRDMGQIGAVLIHPTNPDLVYVAAIGHAFGPSPERGVYRTSDGGRSWQQLLFVSDSTGAVDLEFAPDDPQTIYASMWRAERKPWTIISGAHEGGVYKSTDGGEHWIKLAGGLPNELIGKTDLAVSAADPDVLYVLAEAKPGKGLYRSDDRGESFRFVSDEDGLTRRPFYYLNVDADPNDADVVYANAEGFFKSTDGGETFRRVRTPHGDNHDMWINPDNSDLFVQSNDGGANVTLDGGQTWSSQHNQPTAELYQVDVDDRFPYWLYAGQQDNSTIAVPSLPPYSAPGGPTAYWRAQGGCETGPAVPKPGDPDIVYANCKGRFGRYNVRTGQEQQYYVGAQNLYVQVPACLADRSLPARPRRGIPRVAVPPHDDRRRQDVGDDLSRSHGVPPRAADGLGVAYHARHHRGGALLDDLRRGGVTAREGRDLGWRQRRTRSRHARRRDVMDRGDTTRPAAGGPRAAHRALAASPRQGVRRGVPLSARRLAALHLPHHRLRRNLDAPHPWDQRHPRRLPDAGRAGGSGS